MCVRVRLDAFSAAGISQRQLRTVIWLSFSLAHAFNVPHLHSLSDCRMAGRHAHTHIHTYYMCNILPRAASVTVNAIGAASARTVTFEVREAIYIYTYIYMRIVMLWPKRQ